MTAAKVISTLADRDREAAVPREQLRDALAAANRAPTPANLAALNEAQRAYDEACGSLASVLPLPE